MPRQTFWPAVKRLQAAGLVEADGNGRQTAFELLHENTGEDDFEELPIGDGPRPWNVRIDGGVLPIRGTAFRAYVALAAVADFNVEGRERRQPGRGRAGMATIARYAGMSRSAFYEAQHWLRRNDWYRRKRDRSQPSRWAREWHLVVAAGNGPAGRAGDFAFLDRTILNVHFGFDILSHRERAEASREPDSKCPTTRTPNVRPPGFQVSREPDTLLTHYSEPDSSTVAGSPAAAAAATLTPECEIHLGLPPDAVSNAGPSEGEPDERVERAERQHREAMERVEKARREDEADCEAKRRALSQKIRLARRNAESAADVGDRQAWLAEAACQQQRLNALR